MLCYTEYIISEALQVYADGCITSREHAITYMCTKRQLYKLTIIDLICVLKTTSELFAISEIMRARRHNYASHVAERSKRT